MRQNNLNYDSIQDEHLDGLIRLAYKYNVALETQDILETMHQLSPEEEEICRRAYIRYREKANKIEKEEKKRSDQLLWKKRTSRFVSIAACMILLLGIATPIAIANVEFIRVKILQLLIDVQQEYTEIHLVEDYDASFDVPANWRGEYYPASIPEGYELCEINPFYNEVSFENSNGQRIVFSECSQDVETNLDSENAILSYSSVNGTTAFVIEKDRTIITWSDGIKYFIVETDMSKNDSLNIANSVRRIF